MLTRGQGLDLLTALEYTHGAGATDPRDKVFSIIELLDDRSRSAIRMDYSEHTSAQQIYTEVAKHCIVTGDSIRLLDHAGVTTNLPDIPTWVPDWSRKSRTALDSTLYKAAGSTSTTLCLLECGSKISVRGIIFDFVTNVSLAYPEGTPDDISTMFSASTIVNLDDFARRLYGRNEPMRTRYPTQESLDDAILKTITADTSWANRRCKTEDQRYYQAFQAKYGLGGRGPTTSPSDSSNINAHFNISQVPDVSAGEHENSGGSEQLQRGDSPNESNRESLCEEFLIVICS
jgi:hypothetical protein